MTVRFDFSLDGEEMQFDGNFVKTTTEAIAGEVYERAYLGSGVAVIPLRRERNEVLIVKEMRVHHGESGEAQWKLVTGWMEEHHASFLECAQQELAEEVGAQAQQWEELYDAHHRATISSRKVYFVAYDPTFDAGVENPDGDLIMASRFVGAEELWEMIMQREIIWTRDVLAALIALRKNAQYSR